MDAKTFENHRNALNAALTNNSNRPAISDEQKRTIYMHSIAQSLIDISEALFKIEQKVK